MTTRLSVQKKGGTELQSASILFKSEDMSEGKTDSDFSSVRQLQIAFSGGEAEFVDYMCLLY